MKCGNIMPAGKSMSDAEFERIITLVLVPDAIKTLRQHGQEMVFKVFYYPEKGRVGWDNENVS